MTKGDICKEYGVTRTRVAMLERNRESFPQHTACMLMRADGKADRLYDRDEIVVFFTVNRLTIVDTEWDWNFQYIPADKINFNRLARFFLTRPPIKREAYEE
jgi:hypothetical protein